MTKKELYTEHKLPYETSTKNEQSKTIDPSSTSVDLYILVIYQRKKFNMCVMQVEKKRI